MRNCIKGSQQQEGWRPSDLDRIIRKARKSSPEPLQCKMVLKASFPVYKGQVLL